MNEKTTISDAHDYIAKGDFDKASNILEPLAKKGNLEAIYLLSSFSTSSEESDDEFENRRLSTLGKLTKLGYPPAMSALGVYFDIGELVEHDPKHAAALFESAANLEDPSGMFFHGRNLYYESKSISARKKAINLISNAIKAGNHEAAEFLKQMTSPGKLSELDLQELQDLSTLVELEIRNREQEAIENARAQILAIAQSASIPLKELLQRHRPESFKPSDNKTKMRSQKFHSDADFSPRVKYTSKKISKLP
jgi:TPR repeat protein